MIKKYVFVYLLSALALGVFAQSETGYYIEVEVKDYENDTLYLGQHYGNQQYLKDTAFRSDDGLFRFQGEENLPGGVYLLIMKPDNNFLQLLINPDEHNLKLVLQHGVSPELVSIEGSDDNMIFKEYVSLIQTKSPLATELRNQITEDQKAGKDVSELEVRLQSINGEVKTAQQEIISKYPGSLTALLIQGTLNPEIPTFEGTKQEIELKRFNYYREHYFDYINLQDPRILRTPFLFGKLTAYIDNLTMKIPDSINASLDRIFTLMDGNEETFKYYLIHFLNTYAKSEFVGMDAIYVHLVDQYYARGRADWLDQEQLDKIVDNANRLRPLLIGMKAPDLKMRLPNDEVISLYEVESDYTVLFFWDPDCSHCKKSMPDMIKFHESYKDKGIKVFAVCTKLNTTKEPDGGEKCKEYIKENPDLADWIHVSDPFHLTKYKVIYDLKTTPQIFVLDKEKIIRSKRIGAEQLPDVMEFVFEQAKNSRDSDKSTTNTGR